MQTKNKKKKRVDIFSNLIIFLNATVVEGLLFYLTDKIITNFLLLFLLFFSVTFQTSKLHAIRRFSPGSFAVRSGESFAVLGSFAVQFGDHLRSNLGIICGRGSFVVSGSFAAVHRSLVNNTVRLFLSFRDIRYPISSIEKPSVFRWFIVLRLQKK